MTKEFTGSFPKQGPKPKKRRGMNGDLRLGVLRRDDHQCRARTLVPHVFCRGILQVHHLWRRSQGGPDAEWNLKTVCMAHHTWIHANVGAAKELDLIRMPGQTGPSDPVA